MRLPQPATALLQLLLGALLLAAPLTAVQAQSRPGLVSFERSAIPDDVPAHLSTAMVQDAQGFLWIGTQEGLVRHDGYGFKVFRAVAGDPGSLGGSYVRTLLLDRDGRLWVGTFSGGLSVYDPRTERFTQYRHDPKLPDSLANDRVEGLAQDADGKLWVGTETGLDRLDPASGKFQHFRHDPKDPASLASDQVRGLLSDRQGRLWIGSRDGLQTWSADKGFKRAAGAALTGMHVTKLLQDKRGRIWIGTVAHGAAVLDPARGQLQQLKVADKLPSGGLSHAWIYGFAEVAGGEIWVATFGAGIDVVDPATLEVIDRLRHDGSAVTSIGNDRIGALLVDRAGLVWAGTWGGGLARHDPAARAFRKLRHSSARPEGPSHPAIVRAMEMADGTLWLGTNGNGIDVLGADGRLRDSHRPDAARAGALADGAITCLAQAKDGTIWVATLEGTLHRMKPGLRQFERFNSAQGLPGGPIRSMVFGPDGALWTASQNGLTRIDAGSDRVTSWVHDPADDSSLSGREVEALAFAPDGTLWVGTDHGVNAFNTKTGKAVRILRDPARADSLPDNWVPDLMVATDGRLWLSTQAGVAILTQWDGKSAHFDLLGPRLKLPSLPMSSLLEDAQGQVWLGSRVRIDPKTWRYRSFDRADGNDFPTYYIASRSRTRSGELLFGSPEGLMIVRPELLQAWTYKPPVVASTLTIDGREQPGAGVLAQRTLQPGQRNLRLEFASLDFSAPQKLRYRYRLDGYDKDWIEVDATQRVAAYAYLPPGGYSLRVQGSNRSGAWSPSEWKMELTVVPAWYQTLWWRALAWLLGVLAVVGLFRLRLRQLRLRAAALERTVAERTASLEAAYKRIELASLTDPLTQLHNRRFLEQVIQADLDLVVRRHREGAALPSASDLVLLMLDLDHFKQVNDAYGHAAGDAVLTQTVGLLKLCMRNSDYVVRWGGEEFLLVARFMEFGQGAALAEKIRAAIDAHHFVLPGGIVLRKTVSIGFAPFPFAPGQATAVTLDTLQRIADTALYAAKRSWRNAWVGIEAPPGVHAADIEPSVQHFLADPAAAVASGAIRVIVAPGNENEVRWS